jgi:hypothetical protein
MFTVEMVTLDWLKECLLKTDKVSETPYKANMTKDALKHKAEFSKPQYVVKKNLFKHATFAINKESFEDPESDPYELEEVHEGMTRMIVEHGGLVVDSSANS